MPNAPARSSCAPSWRQLAGLALLVALAHGLILRAVPPHLGASALRDASEMRSFSTRSIPAPPAPEALPAPVSPPAHQQPKARAAAPKKDTNTAAASVERAPSAMDSIALPTTLIPQAPDGAEAGAAPIEPSASTLSTAVTPPATALPAGPKTTPVTAVALPQSVLLKYKMTGASKGLNYNANAELSWNHRGGSYDAHMEVSALFLGARRMTSRGQITPQGLAPERFSDKFRSELAAHFLPDQGKITFSANTPDALWVEGAQDRVSVFMQLGGMLAARPGDFPPGSEITLYTIGPREADTWTFVVEAQDMLALPGGETPAIKVTRKPRRPYDQTVEIWYAPSLAYLPVRNRITQQNGDFIDQQLSSVSWP